MYNQYDVGAKEDFDNMTKELGLSVLVYPREESLEREGFEGDARNIEDNPMSAKSIPREEIVFLQELNSTHEAVASGIFKVGDVRFNFLADSIAEEEGYVVANGETYKILELTRAKNMGSNIIMHIKAFGKKLPNR